MQNLVGRLFSRLAPFKQVLGRFSLQRNMADNTGERSISRLNDQINYTRKFHSPEKVEVLIPTIPYHSFDHLFLDSKIKPWNVIDLLISVRHFAQNPAEHTEHPDRSIVDMHLLPKDTLLPGIVILIDVDQTFHDPRSPKFPLHAEMEITHIGNSSTRSSYSVKHKDMLKPYITCLCDNVIINETTRRTTQFPTWWQTKYSYLKRPKQKWEIPSNKLKSFSNQGEYVMEFEHIDQYSHTSTRTYLKLCTNLAFKSVSTGHNEGHFSCAHLRAGIKRAQIFFHRETKFGDTLIVKMFEDSSKANELYFEIMKLGTTENIDTKCTTVVLQFYEPSLSEMKCKL